MRDSNGPVASEELLLLIERWERLDEEKKAIADDQKDVMAEAKSRGFDTKTVREIIKLRKLTPEQRREREALLDTYKAALGMLDGTPLGKWAIERLKKPEDEAATDDTLYANALRLVTGHRKASVSWLQRMLAIAYNPAAALIERMEREGIVSGPDQVGKREVLAPKPDDWEEEAGADDAVEDAEAEDEAPAEPEPTVEDARRLGTEAAARGAPVTSNPFPAFDDRRAAWDEAWCAALGNDGMEIPDALKPTPKPRKNDKPEGADE